MKRYLINLKSYTAIAFIGTFCLISVVSSFIVVSVFWAFGSDFSVRVERKRDKFSGDFLYLHELDELAFNINKMAYELENINFIQKDFILNVSHEPKTPLSIIGEYCEILLKNPKDSQKFLNLIHAQIHALNELCENILMLLP